MSTLTTDLEVTLGYHDTGLPIVELVTIHTPAEDGWTDDDHAAHHAIEVALTECRSGAVRAGGPYCPVDLSDWVPTAQDIEYIAECADVDVDDVQRILG